MNGYVGLIINIGIFIAGMSAYGSGRYTMTFIGIELSQPAFVGLCAVFMVINIASIVSSKKKAEQVAEKVYEETRRLDAQPKLETPCRVEILRLLAVSGAKLPVQVTLNGKPQGQIVNGQTLVLETLNAENVLTLGVQMQNAVQRTLSFQATAGGIKRFTLAAHGMVVTPLEPDQAFPVQVTDGEPNAKGRYRPVPKGLVLWSVPFVTLYGIGLVPMIQALHSAKEPTNAMAAQRRRRAKKWLWWLTGCFALVFVIMYINLSK